MLYVVFLLNLRAGTKKQTNKTKQKKKKKKKKKKPKKEEEEKEENCSSSTYTDEDLKACLTACFWMRVYASDPKAVTNLKVIEVPLSVASD